jgi:hypothetical protein
MDREAVRILVTSVGYQAAAKELGVNPATLRKRAQREGWNNRRTRPPHESDSRAVTMVTKPSHALDNILAHTRDATRVNMARYAERASREALRSKKALVVARAARDVEGIRASLWPEKSEGNVLTLNVLNAVKVVRQTRAEERAAD